MRERPVPYTVQIRLDGDNLAMPLSEMREWLDRNRIEPAVFKYSMGAGHVRCRLDFKLSNEAAAFADAFAGLLAGA
jgi:hypothetical protein